jgi:hypothetical protein
MIATLVRGDPLERRGAMGILLDPGERVVQEDRVALQAEVLEALDRLGGHRGHATRG